MTSSRGADLRKELLRKAFHLNLLLYIPAFAWLGYPRAVGWAAVFTAAVAAVETARLRSPKARALIQRAFGGIIRDKEDQRYTGTFYSIVGMFLTIAIFGSDQLLVTCAALYLAVGDTAAALAGKSLGRVKFTVLGQPRTLEGCAAGALASFLCGLAASLPASAALVGALAFSVIDAVPLPPDDNLWIPLATAGALKAFGA